MVLKDKVFIGQAEIRVGQEMPVLVTNGGKNQLILIQKNYLFKWKILGRVWKWKLQSKCCSTNYLPVQLDAEYGLLTIQSQSYSSTDWSTNACKLSTLMYLQITILFLTVTSAYEYCAWCHIMWYHVIRTINKPVYSSIIVQLYMYIQECASDLDVDYVLLWGLIVKGCSTFWSSCSDMEGFESFQVKYT